MDILKRQSSKSGGLLDLGTTINKATKKDLKPPKEKHVRNLVITVSQNPDRIQESIQYLSKRLEKPEWMVVMKTLCVFHRILRDATSDYFIKELRNYIHIFNLRKYLDLSSEAAKRQSIFVKKYAQYIEEKLVCYKGSGREFEKTSLEKDLNLNQLFTLIPSIQSQLNALINTRSCREHFNNEIILTCFSLLVKDSVRLYKTLNEGIVKLLDIYFTLKISEAQNVLAIYNLFTKETDGIIHLFQILKKFSPDTILPELNHAPTDLGSDLEAHLKNMGGGKSNLEVQTRARSRTKEFIAVQTEFFSVNDFNSIQTTPTHFDPFGLKVDQTTFDTTAKPAAFETNDNRLPTFTPQLTNWETFGDSANNQQPTFVVTPDQNNNKSGSNPAQPYNPFLNPTPQDTSPLGNASWQSLFQ